MTKREHKAAKNQCVFPRHFRFAGPCRGTFQSAKEREREREHVFRSRYLFRASLFFWCSKNLVPKQRENTRAQNEERRRRRRRENQRARVRTGLAPTAPFGSSKQPKVRVSDVVLSVRGTGVVENVREIGFSVHESNRENVRGYWKREVESRRGELHADGAESGIRERVLREIESV